MNEEQQKLVNAMPAEIMGEYTEEAQAALAAGVMPQTGQIDKEAANEIRKKIKEEKYLATRDSKKKNIDGDVELEALDSEEKEFELKARAEEFEA